MKIIRTLFLLTILVTLFSCKQDGGEKVFTPEDVKNPATAEGIDPKVAEKMPIITFDKLTYDLGRSSLPFTGRPERPFPRCT